VSEGHKQKKGMSKMQIYKKLLSVLLCFTLSGCAVMMAANQPHKVDEGVLAAGMARDSVLAELGAPVKTETLEGKKTDLINFTQGTNLGWRIGRAVFHGVADFFTFFIWELIAIPIESVWGKKEKSVRVIYDATDKVETVQYLKKG
jgi:hypothetical protein